MIPRLVALSSLLITQLHQHVLPSQSFIIRAAFKSMAPRRSTRLQSNDSNNIINCQSNEADTSSSTPVKKKKRLKTQEKVKTPKVKNPKVKTPVSPRKAAKKTLPRTTELSLEPRIVIGVDEAGRGPIAGPVVAAAVFIPATITGVTDSKKITSETNREELYELIISSPNLKYAIAVIDHQRIDEINILQATLEGMTNAVEAVIKPNFDDKNRVLSASASQEGCYTIFGVNDDTGKPCSTITFPKQSYHALVDGNKTPECLSCPSNAIVKGDSLEYCIGAASILAKVTRDRIMHENHELYPEYNFKQHKGYPTKDHMNTVQKIGGCSIHRRSFAPFKEVVVKKKQKITNFFTSKK